MSSAHKEIGHVTNEDIESSAKKEGKWGEAMPVRYGTFQGAMVSYFEESAFWSRWWLRSGRVLVFATYNGPPEDKSVELAEVEAMLQTLRLESQ